MTTLDDWLSTRQIKALNHEVLSELGLQRGEMAAMMHKLADYKFVENAEELRAGSYIRWILLPTTRLTKGATFCRTTVEGNIVCKGFGQHYFTLNLYDNLVFQRLTDQERVLSIALDQIIPT